MRIEFDTRERASTVFDMWAEFRAIFERADCNPQTIELVRHGFYCGAMAGMLLITHGAADESAETITARLDAIREELNAFKFDIRMLSGRAS